MLPMMNNRNYHSFTLYLALGTGIVAVTAAAFLADRIQAAPTAPKIVSSVCVDHHTDPGWLWCVAQSDRGPLVPTEYLVKLTDGREIPIWIDPGSSSAGWPMPGGSTIKTITKVPK